MNVCFISHAAVTKAALPLLKISKGKIGITSSIQGVIPNPARTVYVAAKHAMHGFFNSLRAEIYQYGISITIVCPYYVATNLSKFAVII